MANEEVATEICVSNFTIEHALSCHLGGYIVQRHNNIRDALANMMREVCHDVKVEPALIEAATVCHQRE